MKFQEINEAPINEEGIIGRGVAAAQQLGSKLIGSELSRMSVTDRHAMNIFIKDFLDKASVALGVAVKSSVVDPTIVDTSSVGGGGAIKPTGAPVSALGQKTKQQMLAQRAASAVPNSGRKPTAPGQPSPAAPAATAPKQPAAPAAAAAPSAPKEPVVPAAPAASAKPLTDFGTVGAERAKRAQARAAIPDPDLNVGRKEPKVGSLSETQYQKLNSIFESILLSEAKSITAFVRDFLHTNVPQLNTKDPDIAKALDKLIAQVQPNWKRDKGKSAFTKLAQAAYLLAKMPGSSDTAGAATAGAQGTSNTQGGRTQATGAQGGTSGSAQGGTSGSAQGGAPGNAQGRAQAAPEIAQYTNNILSQINRMQRNDADDLDAIIMNSLRRLYKVNSSAYMDTVQHLKTMLQSAAPTTPAPTQGGPAKGPPNLTVAKESKNRVKR
jgi:hypothetical protein